MSRLTWSFFILPELTVSEVFIHLFSVESETAITAILLTFTSRKYISIYRLLRTSDVDCNVVRSNDQTFALPFAVPAAHSEAVVMCKHWELEAPRLILVVIRTREIPELSRAERGAYHVAFCDAGFAIFVAF